MSLRESAGSSPGKSLFVYQQGLEDLNLASLHFGHGPMLRARIPKSRRATSVAEPLPLRTREKVWNEFDAEIDSVARPPFVPGEHAQAVRDYLRLISTAEEENGME